jgi:hypothetical protein
VRRMGLLTNRIFLVPLLVLLVLFGCRSTNSYYKVSILMDPAMEEKLAPSGDAVTFEEEGIWGALQPLNYENLSNPVSVNREWADGNPFEGVFDEEKMPIVFYLLIENRSESAFTFNPSSSISLFFERAPLFAIEYDDFYQDLYLIRGGEERLAKIRKMLFRSYQTLQPGEQARGLLFFKRPDPKKIKSREILFYVRRVYMGKREFTFTIPFLLQMEQVKRPASSVD